MKIFVTHIVVIVFYRQDHLLIKTTYYIVPNPSTKGQLKRMKVELRYHRSKVEFVRSFLGRNVGLKKSFRLCLTFTLLFRRCQCRLGSLIIIKILYRNYHAHL